MSIKLADMIPGLKQNSAVDLPADITIGGSAVVALATITSASANALTTGPSGATNPAFNVDASTASQAAGLNITGAIAAGTVAAAVISSGSNANLSVNAKGTGTISIGNTSTGAVILPAVITVASAATITGAGTGANGIILKNLKNNANTTVSGTAITITIDVAGTPYYFLAYPTNTA